MKTVSLVIVDLKPFVQLTEKFLLNESQINNKEQNNKESIYIGSTGRQYKSRFYEHTQCLKSEINKEITRLSRFINKIKNDSIDLENNQKGIIHCTNQNKISRQNFTICNLERLELHSQTTTKFLGWDRCWCENVGISLNFI